jgi:ribonucleoside-diphosphate reductase alpha chain
MAVTPQEADTGPNAANPNAIAPETLEFFKGDALRARVFHDKYALRDPNGTVLEQTPVAMWQRIARGLAGVEPTQAGRERYAREFYWLLDGFRFIPGGRIMHAIGNQKRVTALNCLPAGTRVVTRDGIKAIETIRTGEEVLTHRDRFRPVTHTMYRDVEEPLRALRFWYLGDQPVKATGDHPFWAFDGEQVGWVEAKDLTTDHYVKVGTIAETLPSWDLDLANFVSAATLEDEAGRMYATRTVLSGRGARQVAHGTRVRRTIPFDERFGLWLGFFMAEGGVNDNSVYFTFNKDEEPYAEAIYNLTRQLFDVEAAIQRRDDQPGHWMRVYVNSKLMVEFVRSLCGGATYAYEKTLPAWFMTAPTTIQKAFIAGLFSGDGIVRDNFARIFLANPDLIRQVFLILVRLGIVPAIRWEGILKYTRHRGMWITIGTQRYLDALRTWIEGDYACDSGFEESPKNYFYKVVDGDLFVKVKACEWTAPLRQTVYDLTVDDDHSFVSEFAVCRNCYVIPIKEDNIEAIFEWTKEAARTYSLGGGVGADISVLRPEGAPVNNAARTSSGSTSFMELMSLTTGTIGQSGRRGALMITIADNHPDVLAFTKIKRNENKVRYANISVRISDAFMRAVEADGDWTLGFDNDRAHVSRTVNAREIWRELIYGARNHAEPGVIFWDSMKRWSTSEYNGMNITTTNPCSLVGSTLVMTPSGLHRLDRLVEDAVRDRRGPEVLIDRRAEDSSGVAAVRADALAFTGVKRIFRVETTSGFVVRGTCDHKVKVLGDETVDPLHGSKGWKRIDELQPGDVLAVADPNAPGLVDAVFGDRSPYLHIDAAWVQPRRSDAHFSLIKIPDRWDDDLAYLLGYAVGDGSYTHHSSRTHGKRLDIHMHVDDAPFVKPVLDRVTGRSIRRRQTAAVGAAGPSEMSPAYPLHTVEGTRRAWMSVHSGAFLRMLGALGLRPAVAHEKVVPDTVFTAPRDATAGFLRGLFDADGTVSRPSERPAISLSSTSRTLIHQVQQLLQFGIFSTVTTHRADDKNVSRSGLTYTTVAGEHREYRSTHDTYKLSIGGYPSIERFGDAIGSLLPRRREAIAALRAFRSNPLRDAADATRVAAVVDEGVCEPVYDLTVLDTKSFIANGLVVSNSEIPLEPYGCCCLGNLNLAEFVTDEFTPQAQVDWPHLEQALRLATRFLDNVLDYNADKHPLPAQREASLYSRRIGVGFTGLGDLLCKLRLKYDTEEAVAHVDRVFDRIKNIVYDESVNLAIEKGKFPGYDREQHLEGAFLDTLDPKVVERIRAHGLRNVALLTVPPVGSGAALAGTTSGIEPIFDLSYTRRSESLSQNTFTVYHPLVRTYMDRFSLADESELPPFFVTAHEIQPEMRVQMQAAIQKHIDHSISSTVNCPADTTEEGVADIYFKAWKLGCKGITVYRDSSRENILTAGTARSVKAAAGESAAVPAPEAAPAPNVHEVPSVAPMHHKRPRPKVTTGRTERIETPRGRIYVTINEDTSGVCEVFVQSLDVEADAIGRLASLALRTGADPRDVIEQLWRVQSREVAIDRSADGTIVRVATIAQGVALAIGRALYGSSFRPDQAFPMADRLPEPKMGNGHTNGGHGIPNGTLPGRGATDNAPETPVDVQQPLLTFAGVCPDCGSSLVYENGCNHCRSCGYSKC